MVEPVLYRRIKLKGDFNPEDFETRQEFAVSADGTRIPMFIVQRAGTLSDGNNPTLLYGYGGASGLSMASAYCVKYRAAYLYLY